MATIRYTHLSKKQINLIYMEKPCKLNNDELKPKGLWFSKNNEWKDFCIESQFVYSHEYELEINFDNFLIIDSLDSLEIFIKKYYCPETPCIKWNDIIHKYSGIYFDNYYNILDNLRNKVETLKK